MTINKYNVLIAVVLIIWGVIAMRYNRWFVSLSKSMFDVAEDELYRGTIGYLAAALFVIAGVVILIAELFLNHFQW